MSVIKLLNSGAWSVESVRSDFRAIFSRLQVNKARNRRRENGFQTREMTLQTWWGSFGVSGNSAKDAHPEQTLVIERPL